MGCATTEAASAPKASSVGLERGIMHLFTLSIKRKQDVSILRLVYFVGPGL